MTNEAPPPFPPAVQHPRIPARLQIIGIGALTVTIIAAILAGGFYNANLTTVNRGLSTITERQSQQIAQLSKNNDALRSQVDALGHTPVAPPASTVTGEPGRAGANGVNGRDGTSIVSVACQSNGLWLVTYDNGTNQEVTGPCVGAQGVPGQSVTGPPGADGTNGTNGADGQPPFSWTYTNSLGVQKICTRTDPFDANRPTYICNPVTPTP